MQNPDNEEIPLDDEGGEFLNLDDPNLEILDEPEEDEQVQSDDNDEDDDLDGKGNSEAAGDDEGADQGEGNEEHGQEAEDLNVVPDHEPLRDDAFYTFNDPKQKPFHAIAAHPSDPLLFAVAGEAEVIYVVRLTEPTSASVSELLQQNHGNDEDNEEENKQNDSKNSNNKDSAASLVCTLEGHTDTVSLLSFSPNGEWLASGSLDSTVAIWSTKTWERVHSFTDLYGEMLSLLWHPSSLLLVASCDDAQAAMWNVLKGTVVMFFAGHRDAVTCTLWTSDVKKLLTGSNDGSISVFNPKTGAQEISITKDLSQDNAGVTAMCVVGNDQCVVGCEDGTLHVVSLRSGKVVMHLEEIHEQAIETIQYNASLNLLVTSSCDCKVLVWNVSDFSPRTILDAHESVIPCVWADHLLLAGCSDGKVRVWDGRAAQQQPLQLLDGHRRMIFQMVVSTAGFKFVGTASDDGCAKFFPLQDTFLNTQ